MKVRLRHYIKSLLIHSINVLLFIVHYSYSLVPDYEVVPVAHTIHENSPSDSLHRILQMRSFKRDIKLYLEPTEGLLAGRDTPIWKVKGDSASPLGVKYTRIPRVIFAF